MNWLRYPILKIRDAYTKVGKAVIGVKGRVMPKISPYLKVCF